MKLISKKLTGDQVQEILDKKLKWILKSCRPVKVILFGSAASGEMTDASDVDLILLFPNDANLKEIRHDLAKARPLDDWPHDLILETISGFQFQINKGGGACWIAENEGKILYSQE